MKAFQALFYCVSWMQFSHWVMLIEKAVNVSKSKEVAFGVFSGAAEGHSAPELGSEKKLWGQDDLGWEQERTRTRKDVSRKGLPSTIQEPTSLAKTRGCRRLALLREWITLRDLQAKTRVWI